MLRHFPAQHFASGGDATEPREGGGLADHRLDSVIRLIKNSLDSDHGICRDAEAPASFQKSGLVAVGT